MHKASHPQSKNLITVSEYIREFGRDGIQSENNRPRCFVCHRGLLIRASSAPNTAGHFAHYPKAGFCPTQDTSGLPYLGMPPRHPNPERAIKIKALFANNWHKHFVKLNDLVKGLHYFEFIAAIKTADKERIWEYAHLEEYQLPYIFATLMDFPSTNSFKIKNVYARKCWFRCWFDSAVRQYEDLWIHREEPLLLTRAWYRQPQRGKPTLDDLMDFHIVEVTPEFLISDKLPSTFVIEKLNPFIEKHFAVKL